jgi:hypothetical protein
MVYDVHKGVEVLEMIKGYFLEEDKVREIPIKDRTGKNLHLKLEGSVTPKGKLKKDKLHFKISKVVWGQQSNDQTKIILIEELVWDDGRKELRFGYRPQTHEKGLWWWGQSALMAPVNDIKELLQLAKEKGLIEI